MTSQKTIQSLIDDIDGILPKAGSRLPWSKPGDVAAQHRVLERVRSYLVAQQQHLVTEPEKAPEPVNSAQSAAVQQIVQAVTQEMDLLRADLMQPLQADLQALRQQREYLVEEIRELERTKRQIDYLPHSKTPQQQLIPEFSQELMSRCAESLTQQLAQILANWEVQLLSSESTLGAITPATSNRGKVASVMQPQERLEQLRQLQVQSDQLLTTLDANQRTIFEALQRNLQGYQESLSQGLEKMHRLGVQGELLFTALVNRLAQQLGREASTIWQSSVQMPDSAAQTNLATNQSTSETLLPLDALSVKEPSSSGTTVLTALPNPLHGQQMPLQPVQPVEQLPTQQKKAISSTAAQEAIAQSDSTAEDIFLENLTSEDWEIIEGLDSENLSLDLDKNDEIDTFIQLDIDSQVSLPLVEEIGTPSPSVSQDLDSLLDLVNEQFTTVTPSAAAQTRTGDVGGLDEVDKAAELIFSSDNRRREIEELYESLFGTGSLLDTAKSDESQALTPESLAALPVDGESDTSEALAPPMSLEMPGEDQFSSADSVNSLVSEVEDVLFEGLTDPANEITQTRSPDWSTGQSPESWEVLFFEDSIPQSPIEANVAGEAQASPLATNSLCHRESASDQEGVESIAALTDLLQTMGLSHKVPATGADSMRTTTKQQSESHTPETEPQASLVEENYIPASPEEDLLATDELDSAPPELEMVLDQNTLQQLQQDLYSFEEPESQDNQSSQVQSSPSNYLTSPTVTPDTAQVNQHNQRFLMSQELLAEDWEEFALNGLLNEESTFQRLENGATTDLPTHKPDHFDEEPTSQRLENGATTDLPTHKPDHFDEEATSQRLENGATTDLPTHKPDQFDEEATSQRLENGTTDLPTHKPDQFDEESTSQRLESGTTTDSPPEEPDQFDINEEEVATNSIEEEILDNSTPTAQESLESDFDPDFFSFEALELDQEDALSVEPFANEDQTFMELLLDEPVESTTEEILGSPELEFEWGFFSQEAFELEQAEAVSHAMPGEDIAPDNEALSEKVEDESLDPIQNITLPPQTLDNESDAFPDTAVDSEPQEAVSLSEAAPKEPVKPGGVIAPDNEALRKESN